MKTLLLIMKLFSLCLCLLSLWACASQTRLAKKPDYHYQSIANKIERYCIPGQVCSLNLVIETEATMGKTEEKYTW